MVEPCRDLSDGHFDRRVDEKREQHWNRTLTRGASICCHILLVCVALSESALSTRASDAKYSLDAPGVTGTAPFQNPQGTSDNMYTGTEVGTGVEEEGSSEEDRIGLLGEEPSGDERIIDTPRIFPHRRRAPGSLQEPVIQIESGPLARRRAPHESVNPLPSPAVWLPTAQTTSPTSANWWSSNKEGSALGPDIYASLKPVRVNPYRKVNSQRLSSPHFHVGQVTDWTPAKRILPGPESYPRTSLGSWVYTEKAREPGVAQELRRLPPHEGRKMLLATGLLYLVGWLSFPTAVSAAGIALYRALKSAKKREEALAAELARARDPGAPGLKHF